MDGNICRYDDLPVIDERTGERRGIPGQAINCFTANKSIALRNGCVNLWRYPYTGATLLG